MSRTLPGRRSFAAGAAAGAAGVGPRRSGGRRVAGTGESARGGGGQPYTHLWVDGQGETHLAELEMGGFEIQRYSAAPQAVKEGLGGAVRDAVFTELPPGWDNPWHCCPAPQLVVTLSGSWFVQTSDGHKRTFKAGEVLFQDNVRDMPGRVSSGQHYSGNEGAKPCRQAIVQLDREPRIGLPTPL